MPTEVQSRPEGSHPDEVNEVLAGLRNLLARVGSPLIRTFLEEAVKDIAYLTSTDDRSDQASTAA